MYEIFIGRACVRALNLIFFAMSKNVDKVFYAVGKGREVGIYNSWQECKAQIDGISNAKYRKFFSIEEAEEFVNFWKGYASPSKNSSCDETAVSKSKNGIPFEPKNRRIVTLDVGPKINSLPVPKKSSGTYNKRVKSEYNNSLVEKPKIRVGDHYKTAYVSPIYNLQITGRDFNSIVGKKTERTTEKKIVHCIDIDSSSKSSSNSDIISDDTFFNTLNTLNTPDTTFKFQVPENNSENHSSFFSPPVSYSNFMSEPPLWTSTQSIFPKSDDNHKNVSSEKPFVEKEEKAVVLNNGVNENCCSELSELDEQLTTCFNTLDSTLKIITNQKTHDSVKIKHFLTNFLRRLITSINNSVNPQMDNEENVENKIQESTTFGYDNCKEQLQKENESSVTDQRHQETQTPPKFNKLQSNNLSSSFEEKSELRNVDILALSLRLDSFEKRFDSCLKEVGAIVSEMSHIKSEIKEMKEAKFSGSGSASNSPYKYSPRKKEGLTQTTLNFGIGSSSNSDYKSSSRTYSSMKNDVNSEEPETKKARTLKRKLSGGAQQSTEDILRRIKTETVDYTSFTVDGDEYVEVYTDGACQSNGKHDAKAGIGIWFGDGHPLNVAEAIDGSPTNNSAEIQAARVAIELAINAGISKLKILTDSEFLINCATKWIHRWKKNGWTLVNGGQVKNRKELEKLDSAASKISVRWEKVEGHSGIHGNEMADRLANEGAAKYRR